MRRFLKFCRDIATQWSATCSRAVLGQPVQPAAHLETMLELIVGRITSDSTSPRFRACYQEFMQGLDWTAETSMSDLGARYSAAISEYYAPFTRAHEYLLEHYLVSYVHRTLFPLGPEESRAELSSHRVARPIRDEGLILLVHYRDHPDASHRFGGVPQGGFRSQPSGASNPVVRKSLRTQHPVSGECAGGFEDEKFENCAGLAMFLRY